MRREVQTKVYELVRRQSRPGSLFWPYETLGQDRDHGLYSGVNFWTKSTFVSVMVYGPDRIVIADEGRAPIVLNSVDEVVAELTSRYFG